MTGTPDAPTRLVIDLAAVSANYRLLAERAKPAKCAAVVKANAYGLGGDRVIPALAEAGCKTFFVATLDEGIALRGLLPDAEVIVLNGLMNADAPVYQHHRIIPTLNDLGQIAAWQAHCADAGALLGVVHCDTGMARLGLAPAEAAVLADGPGRLRGFTLRGLMSHLACADTPSDPLNRTQLERFQRLVRAIKAPQASLAASSGIFLGPDYHFDMVRPGISLYGGRPNQDGDNPMRPVVRLTAKILQIRDVDAQQTVGYGATHRFDGPARVATIAAGYADGYLRSLGGKGEARVGNVVVPVIGRISMDLITLDVSAVPQLRTGDEVDLIGPSIPIDLVADRAGTISYEVIVRLGHRFARDYIGGTA